MTRVEQLTLTKHKLHKAKTGKEFGQIIVDHFKNTEVTPTVKAEVIFDGSLGLE